MIIQDLISTYNLPVDFDTDPKIFGNWDGTKFNFKGMTEDGILHDICHWIVAEPNRRGLMNFGLGVGPNERTPVYKSWYENHPEAKQLPSEAAEKEEITTCVLELIIASFDLSGSNMVNMQNYLNERSFCEYKNHYMNKENINNFYFGIESLLRKNIISNNWIPIQIQLSNNQFANLQAFKQFIELKAK